MLSGGLHSISEVKRRQLFERRIIILHGILLFICLIIIGRLIELQVVKGADYNRIAQEQQYGGVVLSAKRGEILSRNSKTGESSILATNTTLDLLYIDPLVLSEDHAKVADELAQLLVTPEFDRSCRLGVSACPMELTQFYKPAFDPLSRVRITENTSGSGGITVTILSGAVLDREDSGVPDIAEIRRQFARYIEDRIRKRTVTFVPLLYSANKKQMAEVQKLSIPGIFTNPDVSLVYVNPDLVDQDGVNSISRQLSPILEQDPTVLKSRMLVRPLRYVPIMAKLPPELSQKIKDLKQKRLDEANRITGGTKKSGKVLSADPFRAIALIPEHWRFYPDTRIASHVIGFINALQEPQYGIERTFDSILRGQEGLIASVSDPFGGQIISSDQKFVDPRDGSTIVLTIDRFVQSFVENSLEAMVKKVDAQSGQVIVIDPFTGKIIAMANAPLFDNNSYANVYNKEPIYLDPGQERQVVAEILNPANNVRILKAYLGDLAAGVRDQRLSKDTRDKLQELELLYDLDDITRYYFYTGENNRREIFPTVKKGIWLKFQNNIGVGSYVNRAVQEVYEPGSVMKPVTMAIAIDQGEVSPLDIYSDTGAVKVDVYLIKNALNKYYGKVSMVDCIDFSINTCMTSVSKKLGRKLFQAELQNFGFGQVTGIELDNELPGALKPWREWSPALVMTMAFGQGISATPLQMVTAYTALANGGKLVKPSIIEEIRKANGNVDKKMPDFLGQVIKPETSATITAMLTHSAQVGFAKAGKVKGHRIAGKTGTSQIAGPGGKYETGTGSTVATYAGYAPVDRPRFVILVKLDRPRKDDFGSKSAAPLFREIAEFLFEYYGIPPDEK